jgi:hypothetical protein
MDFMNALSVVKQTIDITKDLRNIDEKIDAATWKLRLNDIIEKLIDTKDALVEAKEVENQLRNEIDRLNKKLRERGSLEDEDGLLFALDDSEKRIGEPYCNHCYVKEDRLYRLVASDWNNSFRYDCTNCRFMHLPGRGKRRS